MPALSLALRRQVLLKIAGFLGWDTALKYRTDEQQRELDATIEQACEYINQQQGKLREALTRQDLLAIEVKHLEDEIKWMEAVLTAAGVKLQDYDYLRCKSGCE